MPKIFVITPWGSSGEKYHKRLAPQSPNCSGAWKNIAACDNFDDADYYIAFWCSDPVLRKKCRPKSVINVMNEASSIIPNPKQLGPETIISRWVTESPNPLTWWVEKTYSELNEPFPEKTTLLSSVTTGRYLSYPRQFALKILHELTYRYPNPPHFLRKAGLKSPQRAYGVPIGHRYRINFLKRFSRTFPGVLDLYGKNVGAFDLSSFKDYKGAPASKWAALASYRYSFAFENVSEPNYFTEKLIDCILAGCMPIYWGCSNLGDFFPKNSYVQIDITKPDSVFEAMDIINSDFREKNLDALKKAKDLVLNKYQFWPAIHGIVKKLELLKQE